jgi:hypothetical protein
VDTAPSKASRASVWCEGREETIPTPSHPLPALLEVSQTALCGSLRRVSGPVSRCLIISTDNTNKGGPGNGSIMWSHEARLFCPKPAQSPPELQRLHRRAPATGR